MPIFALDCNGCRVVDGDKVSHTYRDDGGSGPPKKHYGIVKEVIGNQIYLLHVGCCEKVYVCVLAKFWEVMR